MVRLNSAIADKLNSLSNSVLSGHYIFSTNIDDAYLEKRFSKPEKHSHNLSYEFADNANDLNAYYQIREAAYREILKEENFSGAEDEFDRNSFILIIKANNAVIGGARLTVSTPANPQKMPLEADGFDIQSNFPQLDFTEITYCEMSRLALLPDFRNGLVSQEIHQKFIEVCNKNNIHVGFARTTPLQQRRTKTIFNNLGYEMIIRRDIKLPHNESNKHLNMQFSCVDFTPNGEYKHLLRNQLPVVEGAEEADLEPVSNKEFA